MNQNRFISDSVEWILPTNDADYQAHEYLKILEMAKTVDFINLLLI
jgi:hypothetical protein